jgi:sRNA-binding regulator protein Hfq
MSEEVYKDIEKFYKERNKQEVLKEKKAEAKEAIKEKKKEPREQREAKYWLRKRHKNVEVKLINGEVYKGILHVDWYCRYDVEIENGNERILIPKHSILWVKEIKEEK